MIKPHFVRKGCAGRVQISILPQFLAIEPHFYQNAFEMQRFSKLQLSDCQRGRPTGQRDNGTGTTGQRERDNGTTGTGQRDGQYRTHPQRLVGAIIFKALHLHVQSWSIMYKQKISLMFLHLTCICYGWCEVGLNWLRCVRTSLDRLSTGTSPAKGAKESSANESAAKLQFNWQHASKSPPPPGIRSSLSSSWKSVTRLRISARLVGLKEKASCSSMVGPKGQKWCKLSWIRCLAARSCWSLMWTSQQAKAARNMIDKWQQMVIIDTQPKLKSLATPLALSFWGGQ